MCVTIPFHSVGLFWYDIGFYAQMTHIFCRFFDMPILCRIMAGLQRMFPEYKSLATRPTVTSN